MLLAGGGFQTSTSKGIWFHDLFLSQYLEVNQEHGHNREAVDRPYFGIKKGPSVDSSIASSQTVYIICTTWWIRMIQHVHPKASYSWRAFSQWLSTIQRVEVSHATMVRLFASCNLLSNQIEPPTKKTRSRSHCKKYSSKPPHPQESCCDTRLRVALGATEKVGSF
jgi:hypothetical protein